MKDIIKVISIIIASFAVIITLLLGVRIYQTYQTESNASGILKAVIKFELSKENIIKVNEGMYLTKSDTKVIKEILKNKGWQFEEQMGAGYIFKNHSGEVLTLTTRQVVSSRYLIWQGCNVDKLLSAFTDAIIDFYENTSEPIVIYEQIPFEEGTLVLAEKVTDGEHYPDLHFIDRQGKVIYLTRGSYCWTLNYTQFRGYNIFFGLAGVEKRQHAQNSIDAAENVKKIEALFSDKRESVVPAENIIAHVNPMEKDTRIFKNPQGYILPVKSEKIPEDFVAVMGGGDRLSLSQRSIEFTKEQMPDYLKVGDAGIYNSFAFAFSPMLTRTEWEQGYVQGEILLEGKTDENGNRDALFLRPAGHMQYTDSFILPQNIRAYYLAYNYLESTRFSAGETVKVVYPDQRKLLDCRILKLTSQMVDKEIGQDSLALISTDEIGQIVLPKEKGVYMFVLHTGKETEIQTYTGIFKIY